jgi:Leucine-rich repeat (LRR) protein
MNTLSRRALWVAVTLLVIIMVVHYVVSQRVFFTDPRLEALVREVSGKHTGQIYSWHLNQIETLDAQDRNISDLSGIESLKNLRWLNLDDNQIRDVTPLSYLPRLRYLSLRNNGILCLDSIRFYTLTGLPLEGLSLRHNVVRYPDGSQQRLSDISLLFYFKDLTFLELRDNHIVDFSPIAGLNRLVELDVSQNPMANPNPDFLQDMMLLESLNLRETGIQSLNVLENLLELRYLNIHSNSKIENIEPIGKLVYLETLIMRDVRVADQIQVMSGLNQLQRLNIRGCGIQDLSVIGDLMQAGALQDRPEDGIRAELDIQDNPIPLKDIDGQDGYAPVRPYWNRISIRSPQQLPE